MRGALISSVGAEPTVDEHRSEPVPIGQELIIAMVAAAVNPIDLVIARGELPGAPFPWPFVPGSEGVGQVLTDGVWRGKRVWFEARGGVGGQGSFAELTVVADAVLVELPPRVDPVVAARYGLAGTAAWLALSWRARLRPGETVAVLDAATPMGQIAVQAARVFGARHVLAAVRGAQAEQMAHRFGADDVVRLDGVQTVEALTNRFREASPGGLDVIVDPQWGVAARAALACANNGARLVQLGSTAARVTELPAAAMRPESFDRGALTGRNIDILGQTNAAIPPDVRAEAYRQLIEAVSEGEVSVPAVTYPLAQIALAYAQQATRPHHQIVISV